MLLAFYKNERYRLSKLAARVSKLAVIISTAVGFLSKPTVEIPPYCLATATTKEHAWRTRLVLEL
jgi:hypothetical protein